MERFVDSVLAGLTLEEKLGQLTQNVLSAAVTGPQLPEASTADIRAGRIGSFLGTSGAEVTRNLQRVAMEQSRAKIPLLFAYDTIHGFTASSPHRSPRRRLGSAASDAPHASPLPRRREWLTGPSRRWWTSRAIRGGGG
jgi:beta-glucosidase-like glycosyl hydrolase